MKRNEHKGVGELKKLKGIVVIGALALAFFALVYAGNYKKIVGAATGTFTISDLGDTLRYVLVEGIAAADIDDSSWYIDDILGDSIAYVTPAKVIKITPIVMDSFLYSDSVDGTVDAGADTVSWLSPVYTMRLTPVVDTSQTYKFQLIYASADTAEFTFDAGAVGTEPVLASLIDSLIDSLTGIAAIADSVTAHDSATYIKLIAKYATETHGGRWSVRSDPILDPRMTPRTGGRLVQSEPGVITTVALICDSMVSRHNAETTTKDSVLATDYGTYWTLSTKHGSQANTLNLPNGWSLTCYGTSSSGEDADSAVDTSTTTAATIVSVVNGLVAAINATATVTDTVEAINSGDTAYYLISRRYKQDFANAPDSRFTDPDTVEDKTSNSTSTDSVFIASPGNATTLQAKIVLGDPTGYTASKITGLTDSGIVWLMSSGPIGSWVIDSAIGASPPVTLTVTVGDQDGDSLLSEFLVIKWYLMDSISDTSGVTLDVPLTYDILVK